MALSAMGLAGVQQDEEQPMALPALAGVGTPQGAKLLEQAPPTPQVFGMAAAGTPQAAQLLAQPEQQPVVAPITLPGATASVVPPATGTDDQGARPNESGWMRDETPLPQPTPNTWPPAPAPPSNVSQASQFLQGLQMVPNPVGGDPWGVNFDAVDHDPFAQPSGLYQR